MTEKFLEKRAQAKLNHEPVLRDKSLELLIKTALENDCVRILEVGTNVGLSGIALLLSNKNARLTGIEINEEKANQAIQNYKEFGVYERTQMFLGDATEIIPLLTGEYDLIFLDGPKGHYAEYLPNLMSNLKVGGIIFADNVLFRGYVNGKVKTPHKFNTTKNSMTKYLNSVTHDERLQTQIIDIEDGVSITKRIK